MFCNKCGNQVPDDARFCPKCGRAFMSKEAREALEGIRGGAATPSNARTKRIVLCAIQALLAIVSLMPLFKLNLPFFYAGGISMPDIVGAYFAYGDQLSRYTAYMQGELFGAIFWCVILLAAWIAGIVAAVRGVIKVVRGESCSRMCFVWFLVFFVLGLATMGFINSVFGSATWQYGFSSANISLVEATSSFWLLLAGSVVGLIASAVWKD